LCDRRWRWAFGQISGNYNLRRDDGQLCDGTERTPAQLAELCLEAMGETAADLSELPNDSRPTVEWHYRNPAAALEQLAAHCNCRIVLGADNLVRLRRMRSAASNPTSALLMHQGLASIAPAAPGRLTLVTDRVRIQADFRLEAVGLDVDQELRPLDELSYRPYEGWTSVDCEHFQAVIDPRARELARRSVFRWYRIATPLELPIHGTIHDLSLIVPIEGEQVWRTHSNSPAANLPTIVFGVWCDYPLQAANRADRLRPLSDDPRSLIPVRFEFDRERGLVRFAEPVFRYAEGPHPAPADLVLRASVGVRDPHTRAWRRLERVRELIAGNDTTEYLHREELIPIIVAQYDPATYALAGATNNFADIFAQADAELERAASRYYPQQPMRAVFAGLHACEPDGDLDVVTWSVGPQGVTTEVIRHDRVAPSSTAGPRQVMRLDTQQARRDLRRQSVA
jgi:hypothetical protein